MKSRKLNRLLPVSSSKGMNILPGGINAAVALRHHIGPFHFLETWYSQSTVHYADSRPTNVQVEM
jgi:hypothetical protein